MIIIAIARNQKEISTRFQRIIIRQQLFIDLGNFHVYHEANHLHRRNLFIESFKSRVRQTVTLRSHIYTSLIFYHWRYIFQWSPDITGDRTLHHLQQPNVGFEHGSLHGDTTAIRDDEYPEIVYVASVECGLRTGIVIELVNHLFHPRQYSSIYGEI